MGIIFTSSEWHMICNTPGALQGIAYLGIPLGGFDTTGPGVSFRNNVVNSISIISYSHKPPLGMGYVWICLGLPHDVGGLINVGADSSSSY